MAASAGERARQHSSSSDETSRIFSRATCTRQTFAGSASRERRERLETRNSLAGLQQMFPPRSSPDTRFRSAQTVGGFGGRDSAVGLPAADRPTARAARVALGPLAPDRPPRRMWPRRSYPKLRPRRHLLSAKGGSAVSLTPRERIAEHIQAIVLGCLAEAADY
jgi:hypothetical protein